MNQRLAIQGVGLVTSVGLGTAASCAAMRAKLTNPQATGFVDSTGEAIAAHEVPMDQPWRGVVKLAKMASMAIDEACAEIGESERSALPVLICVAEPNRPGRTARLEELLVQQIRQEQGPSFARQHAFIAHGRVSLAVALAQARRLIHEAGHRRVLVVAADSLLNAAAVRHYERADRLLTERNSSGFMLGEGAGALLVGADSGDGGELLCTGIGFASEAAAIGSDLPLRAEGLSSAIRAALAESGCELQDMHYRITDISGEHYYFKEAALALTRVLRVRMEEFDLWHPAECTGETGAVVGVSIVAQAWMAAQKGYAPGPNVLAHMANDSGQRAAICMQQRSMH